MLRAQMELCLRTSILNFLLNVMQYYLFFNNCIFSRSHLYYLLFHFTMLDCFYNWHEHNNGKYDHRNYPERNNSSIHDLDEQKSQPIFPITHNIKSKFKFSITNHSRCSYYELHYLCPQLDGATYSTTTVEFISISTISTEQSLSIIAELLIWNVELSYQILKTNQDKYCFQIP